MNRLLEGYAHFRTHVFPAHAEQFRKLAHGQHPEAVLITCSDSRVMPEMILQCEPGQVFPIRNAGNLAPAAGHDPSGVAATIEYAVRALKIPDIIVCGHSGCGAMRELLEQAHTKDLPEVTAWLRHAGPSAQWLRSTFIDTATLSPERRLQLITQANIVTQLEHLKQYPAVREGLHAGTLRLHGWVYDIASGEILELSAEQGAFLPLADRLLEDQRKVA